MDELVRGVKYTIEGLEQVVLEAPLPANPGDLTAEFNMRVTINGAGKVVRLEPLQDETTTFESAVLEAVLQWQFSTLPDATQINHAVITIAYRRQ